jgi:hypothetical protein
MHATEEKSRVSVKQHVMFVWKSSRQRLANFQLSAWAKVLLFVACVMAVDVIGWSVLKTRFYRAAIPAQIGIAIGPTITGSSMGFWEAMLPIRHKACGGAIFVLSDTTLAAIRDGGLDVLKDARQGRGYTDNTDRLFYYYSYKPWQPTPLPAEWTPQEMWYGLSCMNLGHTLGRNIVEAAQAHGSFYTTGMNNMLLIVPSLKLAVYTYTS